MNTTNLKVAGGVILGVAAGTIAGLLTSPHNGKENRAKLNGEVNKARKKLAKATTDTLNSIKTSYLETVKDLNKSLTKAKEDMEKK